MELKEYLHQNYRTLVPEWLEDFNPKNPEAVSNLVQSFLNSRVVFYPGSGRDGSAVQFFNEASAAQCFLYVDCGMTRDEVEHQLHHHGFRGYSSIARLSVSESDMGANHWIPHMRPEEVLDRLQPEPPYAFLEILEKRDDAVAGASRIAILFLAADGHAAYDALFCQKDSSSVPFGIVVQDHGFGGNWGDFGAGGVMETIARRAASFPVFLLVGDNTNAWEGYTRVANVDPVAITAMRTRSLFTRDFDDLTERDDMQTLRREALPDLIFDCPVALSDHYQVPADNTHWPAPLSYHQLSGQGQSPHRPRASFRSHPKALIPRSDVQHFDAYFGVYILAVDHPSKAFYVGIAAANGKKPEGVGSRVRKHRVKLTASHVGSSLPCGSPANVGGVNHTGGWRPFAAERYQYHLASGADDCCADVRLMAGTAGDNAKKILEDFESAILHDASGIRSRIYNILWPSEDKSNVVILNTVRGRAPDSLPGAVIMPEDCAKRNATSEGDN